MSLNFAAISPHPPIIVPEVGKEEIQKVSQTLQAMKKLAHCFSQSEIDTLIVISPHMLTYPDCFNIAAMKKLFGTFASFGAPELILEYPNDLTIAREIDQKSQKAAIKTFLYDNHGEFFELDHGLMVPLFYLTITQESPIKIVPIAFSNLSRTDHFSFGQIIGEVAKETSQRIGVLASGDLSHRLIQGAPGGFSQAGKEFDKKFVGDIKNNNIQEILSYEEDFVEDAGECGYRSILILLGVLDNLKLTPEILSYQGPFGVGYLVANYKLP